MKPRYFVALDAAGVPQSQRASQRGVRYLSADRGASYSKNPPNASRPLRVVEVERPLEWVTAVAFPSGVVTYSSKQLPPRGTISARLFVDWNDGSKGGEHVTGFADQAELDAYVAKPCGSRSMRVLEVGPISTSLKNWPQAVLS